MLYESYHVAHSLAEAVELLTDAGTATVRPIAGGTDLMLQLRERLLSADRLVDIGAVPELKCLRLEANTLRIGAAVTYRELADSALVRQHAALVADASRAVGATQIQNMGTIGGNIGNASPAGDSLPCLYALDARVSLVGATGERTLPIADLIRGYRQTDLRPGELIKDVSFRVLPPDTGSAFIKLGLRQGQAISVVMLAVVLQVQGGTIRRAAVALGAVAPTIVRSPAAEAALLGQAPSRELFERAGEVAQEDIRPIDDLRATAAYRRHVTRSLVRDALSKAWARVQTGA